MVRDTRRNVLRRLGLVGLTVAAGCASTEDGEPSPPGDGSPVPTRSGTRVPTETTTGTGTTPTETSSPTDTEEESPTESQTETHTESMTPASGWPQFAFDSGNSGHRNGGTPLRASPTPRWKRRLGRVAVEAAPIVTERHLYVGTLDGTVYALDRRTGRTEWRRFVGGVRGAGLASTEHVFFGTTEGKLACLSRESGESVWETELAGTVRGGVTHHGNMILVPTTADRPNTSRGTPAPEGTTRLWAVDAGTGEVRWSVSAPEWNSLSPAVAGDTAVVATEEGAKAVDVASGDERWRISFAAPYLEASPVAADGSVYLTYQPDGDDKSRVVCRRISDGSRRWSTDLAYPSVKGTPALADGRLYVPCHVNFACGWGETCEREGRYSLLYALDAATGQQVWKREYEEPIAAGVSVVGQQCWFGRGRTLTCVDRSDGSIRATVTLADDGEDVITPPTIEGGMAYAGTGGGLLFGVA